MNAGRIDAGVVSRLKQAAGAGGWIADPADKAPYLTDIRGLYRSDAPLVLRPATTAAVAEVVRICAAARLGVVPQGGNTGLVGGSVPAAGGGEIVLSLARMNRIRALDPLDYSLTAEAGCVLADVQQAADDIERLFPLSLAAEGSCQIGGNLATNAGGTAVLRYGNARDLVLGLEVVLADGRIWDGLRALRKDNAGYDLKHCFLGSEGTLGIITAAVLKLFPRPRERVTALLAVPGAGAALRLLAKLRTASGDTVSSFELISRPCLDLVIDHIPDCSDPLATRYSDYVLAEIASSREDAGLAVLVEGALERASEEGLALDGVVAASEAQAARLWRLRESIPEAQIRAGGGLKHDVSVPLEHIGKFLEQATAAVTAAYPRVQVIPFGHLGDGNLHFNLAPPPGEAPERLIEHGDRLTPLIHDLAMALGGSFSAEHGIGVHKKADLARYRPAVELDLMRTLKRALDPQGILNPGKVI